MVLKPEKPKGGRTISDFSLCEFITRGISDMEVAIYILLVLDMNAEVQQLQPHNVTALLTIILQPYRTSSASVL